MGKTHYAVVDGSGTVLAVRSSARTYEAASGFVDADGDANVLGFHASLARAEKEAVSWCRAMASPERGPKYQMVGLVPTTFPVVTTPKRARVGDQA